MSMETTVYIGPYIEITTTKEGRHCEELFDGEEPLLDVTDYLTGKPEGKRILIPNMDRGASRRFWVNPNDFVGFEVFNDSVQIEQEVSYLTTKFEAEFQVLRTYYTTPDEGWVRWGYFTYEM